MPATVGEARHPNDVCLIERSRRVRKGTEEADTIRGLNGPRKSFQARPVGTVADDHELQIVVEKSQDVKCPDRVAKAFAALDGTNAQERVSSGQWAVSKRNGNAGRHQHDFSLGDG